jgi:hypothetical protein
MTVVLRIRKDRKETWALGALGALQLSTIRHCTRHLSILSPAIEGYLKGWLRLSTQKFTIRYLLARLFLSLPSTIAGHIFTFIKILPSQNIIPDFTLDSE